MLWIANAEKAMMFLVDKILEVSERVTTTEKPKGDVKLDSKGKNSSGCCFGVSSAES